MKNKPNFFFDNRGFPNWGGGGGGSAAWEFFPHNPVFFSDNVPYVLLKLKSKDDRWSSSGRSSCAWSRIDISVGSPEEDDDCNPERKSHRKASKAPAWILPEIKTTTVSKNLQSGM